MNIMKLILVVLDHNEDWFGKIIHLHLFSTIRNPEETLSS